MLSRQIFTFFPSLWWVLLQFYIIFKKLKPLTLFDVHANETNESLPSHEPNLSASSPPASLMEEWMALLEARNDITKQMIDEVWLWS